MFSYSGGGWIFRVTSERADPNIISCEFEDALEEKLVDTSGIDLGNLSRSEMSIEIIKDFKTGEVVWSP